MDAAYFICWNKSLLLLSLPPGHWDPAEEGKDRHSVSGCDFAQFSGEHPRGSLHYGKKPTRGAVFEKNLSQPFLASVCVWLLEEIGRRFAPSLVSDLVGLGWAWELAFASSRAGETIGSSSGTQFGNHWPKLTSASSGASFCPQRSTWGQKGARRGAQLLMRKRAA